MNEHIEQLLVRELDEVADGVAVPALPDLPRSEPRPRWRSALPMLVAAAAVVAVIGTLLAITTPDGSRRTDPAPSPTVPAPTVTEDGSTAKDGLGIPFVVAGRLYVGTQQVPGQWWWATGRGTHWVGQKQDGSWWWGFDAEPQEMDALDQPPAISPGGGYTAHVVRQGDGAMLVGADTEYAGEGFGGVTLPGAALDPPPRAVGVTDDGLVVASARNGQWLWRPLVDLELLDLRETAPGQVVVSHTDAGFVVNAGEHGEVDGTMGEPYLASIAADGTLTRLASLPTHDVLEASAQWVAFVPPGNLGGEALGTTGLEVQRWDGSQRGTLTAPEGWLFPSPGFRWETEGRLLAVVRTLDGRDEGLVRCEAETMSCAPVDLP